MGHWLFIKTIGGNFGAHEIYSIKLDGSNQKHLTNDGVDEFFFWDKSHAVGHWNHRAGSEERAGLGHYARVAGPRTEVTNTNINRQQDTAPGIIERGGHLASFGDGSVAKQAASLRIGGQPKAAVPT